MEVNNGIQFAIPASNFAFKSNVFGCDDYISWSASTMFVSSMAASMIHFVYTGSVLFDNNAKL